jgi:Tfp pilus assembly PilM family ATPase
MLHVAVAIPFFVILAREVSRALQIFLDMRHQVACASIFLAE